MKLVKPSIEILNQEPSKEGINKIIEIAGRTCYKSEDKITEDSSKEFVQRMMDSGHCAMLEHGTVYLYMDSKTERCRNYIQSFYEFYNNNKYSDVKIINYIYHTAVFVTTNLRVLFENNEMRDLTYLCEPTEHHEKRKTVKMVIDRGVSHEFVRHRVFSFAQESTRYCNYSKDKFSNELTFIEPIWLYDKNDECRKEFESSLKASEKIYLKLLDLGWKPQQARNVLPNALKTELVMTGTKKQWDHFFMLRCANSAHPQAREVALEIQKCIKF